MRSPWKSWLPVLCALLVVIPSRPAGAEVAPEEALAEAIDLYHNGGYPEAAARLNALLYPLKLKDRQDILQARVYLGLSSYILGRKSDAQAEFQRVLDMDPNHQLDPLYTPPDILAFFEALRRRQLESRPTPSSVPTSPPAVVPERASNIELLLDLAPLGVAQLRAGRPVHGAALLAGEVTLGAVATGTWIWLILKTAEIEDRDTGGFETAREQQIYLWTRRVNQASFATNGALVLYGAADAIYRTRKPPATVGVLPGPGLGLALELRF